MNGRLGIVIIGRNEGERLVRCLASVQGRADAVVYVDSGSSDGSVDAARALGADVVELDVTQPFTAARARNAGAARARDLLPHLDRIQFVDGDCEVREGWIEDADRFLDATPDVAVACGRRRERHPETSVYNRLADMEWDTPAGEAEACGGDALVRAAPFFAVGGYRDDLIAGEEPELCLRLRRSGHRIVRLDREMTWHDACILRFGQWWKRTARGGHAYAEAVQLHGRESEASRVRSLASIVAWGMILPVAIVVIRRGWVLAVLWLALWTRIAWRRRRLGDEPGNACLYATSCVVGKVAQAQGVLQFAFNRLRRRRTRLLEYR